MSRNLASVQWLDPRQETKLFSVAHTAWQLTCGQGSAFPTQYLQQWELLKCNRAPRQPGANLPLPLMWLGWHFPQCCQAVSPCLSGTHKYLQQGGQGHVLG